MPHVHRVVRLGNERHYLHARCCADNLPEPCVVISVEVADRSRSEAPNKYINTSTTTGGHGHDGRRPDNMDCRILGPYYFSIFTVSTKMKHTTALSGGFPWPPDSILRPEGKAFNLANCRRDTACRVAENSQSNPPRTFGREMMKGSFGLKWLEGIMVH